MKAPAVTRPKRNPLLLLLRNEVTVRWREMTGETKPLTLVLVAVGVLALIGMILAGLASSLRGVLTHPLPSESVYLAALVLVVLFPFGVSTGINHAVIAMFDRGDLDLLVSSPIGSRTIFASRVLAVAVGVFLGLGLFMLPIAFLGLILGLPQLLGVIPTLVALAITCASIGMLITLLLVKLLGPRRARTVSQLLAALTVLVLFLVSQLPAILGERIDVMGLVERIGPYFDRGGVLAADSLLWLPARSMLLHPLGTAVALALAGAVMWLTVLLLHRSFAHGVGLSDGARRRRTASGGAVSFKQRSPTGVLLAKEWRLVLRDPYLISQVLLQIIYLLPAGYVLFFQGDGPLSGVDLGPGISVLLVAISGTLAASLARIAFVGEESIDLLMASPVGRRRVRNAKMLAALIPVLTLTLTLSIALAFTNPVAGLIAAALAAASAFSVALLRSWNPARASRKDLFKNRGMGDPIVTFMEGLLPFSWAASSYLLATGNIWCVPLLLLCVGAIAFSYFRVRMVRPELLT